MTEPTAAIDYSKGPLGTMAEVTKGVLKALSDQAEQVRSSTRCAPPP